MNGIDFIDVAILIRGLKGLNEQNARVIFSSLPLAELSTIVREHLEQFTDVWEHEGNVVCNVLLFPYQMNGAARGYKLAVPAKDWEGLKT